ncbi:DUF1343 domain-containing protein, partial [Deinococcus sp. 6GRE01]|nr:DUF1343 domain-containing protein [Deinococcus sp. 6GRE01]
SGAPGEAPELERDAASGLPTTVLYHLSAEETARRLAGLDTLIVDLQDVGVRFYTYVSTVRDVLRAARLRPLRIVILDRPNPLGFTAEGPLLDPAFESYVGISAQLPLRHGLTIGEVTRVLAAAEGVPVHVIPTDAPDAWHPQRPWVPPSPNLPDLDAFTGTRANPAYPSRTITGRLKNRFPSSSSAGVSLRSTPVSFVIHPCGPSSALRPSTATSVGVTNGSSNNRRNNAFPRTSNRDSRNASGTPTSSAASVVTPACASVHHNRP